MLDIEIGNKIIEEALKHVGVTEIPPKSDNTPFGEWAQKFGGQNEVAWCGNFASFCVYTVTEGKRAICENIKIPESGYISKGLNNGCFGIDGVCAGCDHAPTIERWGKSKTAKKILWVEDPMDLVNGDILCIDVGAKKNYATHIGVFYKFEDDGSTCLSIEGNYSNKVSEVRRDIDGDEFIGAIRFL